MTLYNGSFELGWTDDGNRQVPNGWNFGYDEDTPNPYDPNPHSKFGAPELRVLTVGPNQLPEHERDLFILDGDYTLKIFRGRGAWFGVLDQSVELTPGQYCLTTPVFADLVKGHTDDGEKIWADDPEGLDGLLGYAIGGVGQGGWRKLVPGAWNNLSVTFDTDGGLVRIAVMFMLPFALENSGIFADNFSLEKIAVPPEECRGDPREKYARTYYVFPQDAEWEDHSVLVKDLFEMRRTIGFSWDDAGIGDLDNRTAMMVALEDEQVAINWFDEYYKGVNVGFVKTVEPPPTRPVPQCMISLHRQTDEEGIEYFLNKVQPEWIKTVDGVEDARKYKDWGAKNVDVRYYVYNSKQYIDTCDVQGYLANFEDSLEANIDYIDAVEDLNEENYADPKVIAFLIGMSNEFVRRWGNAVKLASGNWPVGNGEGKALLEWARVIAENGHLACYHPYHPVHPDWAEDWMETQAEWYHLRHLYHIDPYLVANGVHVDWLGTESGAVAGVPQGTRIRSIIAALSGNPKPIPGVARLDPGFIAAKKHLALVDANSVGPLDPTGGWRDKNALNRDLDRYIALQLRLSEKKRQWNPVNDNRDRGDTIFTVGAGYVGWSEFKLYKHEMEAFAEVFAA